MSALDHSQSQTKLVFMKDEKIQELKNNIKMLEQKLVSCNDLLKINELHKKGKLKTVDFLW